MKKNNHIDILKDLGLDEYESKVYIAGLSLGPTTILKLARSAEIKRTTVYDVVESLKKKGLMAVQIEGFKKKYTVEDPQKLGWLLEQKRKNFENILPEFSGMYNLKGGEESIKYYQGLESLKSVYESLITDILPDQEYLVIGNQEQWLDVDTEYFKKFVDRRAKLPIKIKMLLQDNEQGRYYKSIERNINAEVRLLPPYTSLTTNLVITPQKVLIHQLNEPIGGIVMKNKSVIQMNREMFEVMWLKA